MADASVDGLLHLSAMTVAITIAYIGLDRVRLEVDRFQQGLEATEKRIGELLLRYDVKRDQPADPKGMFSRFPFKIRMRFYVLCHVARANIGMGLFSRIYHCVHRQKYVPMLRYYRHRGDRAWMMLLAALAILEFLYLTSAAIWHIAWFPYDGYPWISMEGLVKASFLLSSATLLWVCISVALAYRLQHIDPLCAKIQKDIEEHINATFQDAVKAVGNHAASAASAPHSPPAA